jgi:hypothetical protein
MKPREPKGERVRRSSDSSHNKKIDKETIERISNFRKRPWLIKARLRKLDKEWDIERALETNMSVIALAGLALSVFVNRNWLLLPATVLVFFFQHAVQGWCPPIPIFRALGVRTRPEIDREKYALKAVRGDFRIAAADSQQIFNAVSEI